MIHPQRVVSLWDMLELNALGFLHAITELRRINTIIDGWPAHAATDPVLAETRAAVLPSSQKITVAVAQVGCKSAWVVADRLESLLVSNDEFNVGRLQRLLQDIESRFADHLQFIKLFVIQDERAGLFSGADHLLGEATADLYPSIWFDCEEAAKCLCLGRATASVFHSMRMLEVGIKALAARLAIPDPIKAAERNWGKMLDKIVAKIDELYPSSKTLPGTEGAFLREIYVSLDAIKNPWRNATMHVENVYTDEEARHILSCSAMLLQKMASRFDENGTSPMPLISIGEP